jgi:hypothetical protein
LVVTGAGSLAKNFKDLSEPEILPGREGNSVRLETEQHERYAPPNENDFFLPIMPEDQDIVLHIRIAIEKLVAPAKDEHAHHDQSDNGNCKCNAQRWDGAFDYRGESGYLVTNQRAHFYPQFVLRANRYPPRRLQ